jgi:hypothetical protein
MACVGIEFAARIFLSFFSHLKMKPQVKMENMSCSSQANFGFIIAVNFFDERLRFRPDEIMFLLAGCCRGLFLFGRALAAGG